MNHADAMDGGTAVITTMHIVIIILLAIAAILMIWWGGRRRARRRAEREASGLETVTARDALDPSATRPPVTPSPPPLVEEPEPVRAAPPVETAPASAPATTGDDAEAPVTLLKGLGPKVAARLQELGIATVGQIAALSPAEAEALDADLGTFRGRMARDRWIEQARLLATGDRAAYEATFGKLG
jgi:predicted flap endonuclease-1-like 5' DNA nuclease